MNRIGISVLFFFLPLFSNAQIITTYAGNASVGYSGNGGPAINAKMYQPNQVIVDANGNLYIAESGNNVIRKVDASGIISVVAGTSSPVYSGDGGPATAAGMYAPIDMAIDSKGNMYIATYDYRIRKVDATGNISTFAGTGVAGYTGDGGPAINASFVAFALALDKIGNLYLADINSNVVRKIDTSGIISTVAGNGSAGYTGDGGPAIAATFNGAADLAFDKEGDLFVVDAGNSCVRKIDTAGIITTIVGNGSTGYHGDGGLATNALLTYPYAMCIDTADNIYITDNGNACIREIYKSSGIIQTVAGVGLPGYTGDGGLATQAQLDNPGGVITDNSGNIFIADFGNNVIRKVTTDTATAVQNVTNNTGSISFYPNPATTQLTIRSTVKINQVAISNMLGQVVFVQSYNEKKVAINIASLAAGVYNIKINNEPERKFVKE